MKNMSKAQENWQAPPPGRYLSTIIAAEATVSKKGSSMLKLSLRIDGDEHDGIETDDYLITDGSAKGAGIGKRKLRGIGTPLILRAIDTDEDIPDAVIANELVGVQLFVDYGNEQKMGRSNPDDPSSPFDRPMTVVDARTGKEVPLNKLTVTGYSRHGTGVAVAAPAQQAPFVPQQAPQQFQQAQAPQGFMPQQFAPQQGQPQFAPQQQFAQPQGYPQQFAPQQAFPQGQPMQMAFPQGGVAQPAWNNGAPVNAAPADEGGKKKRKIVEG